MITKAISDLFASNFVRKGDAPTDTDAASPFVGAAHLPS